MTFKGRSLSQTSQILMSTNLFIAELSLFESYSIYDILRKNASEKANFSYFSDSCCDKLQRGSFATRKSSRMGSNSRFFSNFTDIFSKFNNFEKNYHLEVCYSFSQSIKVFTIFRQNNIYILSLLLSHFIDSDIDELMLITNIMKYKQGRDRIL